MPVTMLPLLPIAEGDASAAVSHKSGTIGLNGSIVTGITPEEGRQTEIGYRI